MSGVAVQSARRGHPDTSTIFVLGVLGIAFFPLGWCAWYFGARLLRKYDANPGRWGRRGWVEAGRIIGLVGLGLNVLLLLVTFATSL